MEGCFRVIKRKKERKRKRRKKKGGREGGREPWKIPLFVSVMDTRTSKSYEIMVLFVHIKFSDITIGEIRHPNDISQSKDPISDTVNVPPPSFQPDCMLNRNTLQKLTSTLVVLIWRTTTTYLKIYCFESLVRLEPLNNGKSKHNSSPRRESLYTNLSIFLKST